MAEPLDGTPLQFRHLTRAQQGTANKIVSDFGSSFSDHARTAGKSLIEQADRNPTSKGASAKRSKGNRLVAVGDWHHDKPLTLRSAALNRAALVERAAQPENKHSNEAIGGAGWYFDAHKEVAAKAHDVPIATAAAASSAMSPGADPESERKATGALAAAHSNRDATVNFSSQLTSHLKAQGHDLAGAEGRRHISDVPAHLIPALAHPSSRHIAEANSSNVDWAGIGSVANGENIAKATKIMRGETPLHEAQNPYGAPKTWSYTDNIVRAKPNSPEHMEYQMRADHLGASIRGEVHGSQQMLDYHGLRSSNEGILSNNGHTAEDSWMRAISIGHSNPATMKGAGDINPTRKAYKTPGANPGETVVHSVSRNAAIKPVSVYHAWNNEATHKAAEHLQKKHGLEYTVPSTLVQETSWTQVRKDVGADPQWNAHMREGIKAGKAEAKAARVPAPQSADLLPGTNTAAFKKKARGE